MKPGHLSASAIAILAVTTGLICTPTVHAQQPFGPSPQALYKQHPGSAPTYVNYGSTGPTSAVVAAQPAKTSTTVTPKPAQVASRTPTRTQSSAARGRVAVHRTLTSSNSR